MLANLFVYICLKWEWKFLYPIAFLHGCMNTPFMVSQMYSNLFYYMAVWVLIARHHVSLFNKLCVKPLIILYLFVLYNIVPDKYP